MKQTITAITALLLLFVLPLNAQNVDERGVRSKSFTVSKGGSLNVSVRSGDVRINSWNKNEVFVRAEGIDNEDLEYLTMKQSGNRVSVEFRPRGNWGWGRGPKFDISIPADFNVDMKTSGGDLEVVGAITGKIEGKTSGGDIRLEDAVGSVEMSTSGGDIRVGNIKGSVELSTSGGDIDLKKVDGDAEVRTSGGDIKVESVGKRLQAKTSGGDIEIGTVGGEVTASTAGGDVKVGKVSGGARLRTSGGDIRLMGASGNVDASTAGGDIDLRDITGSIEAKTAGGDIKAEMRPSGKGTSELKTAGGDIRLAIPDNAKATIEAVIYLEGRWGSRKDRYEIRSDFKAETHDLKGDGDEIRARYVLNGGGEKIYLQTTNSNIEIRKLR